MTAEEKQKAQFTFDHVASSLLAQGKKSMEEGQDPNHWKTNCLYRGAENTKCGIGFLIPDDTYYKELEGQPANSQEVISCIPTVYYLDPKFLNGLQKMHDNSPVEEWRNDFSQFAHMYGLNTSVLEVGNLPENH